MLVVRVYFVRGVVLCFDDFDDQASFLFFFSCVVCALPLNALRWCWCVVIVVICACIVLLIWYAFSVCCCVSGIDGLFFFCYTLFLRGTRRSYLFFLNSCLVFLFFTSCFLFLLSYFFVIYSSSAGARGVGAAERPLGLPRGCLLSWSACAALGQLRLPGEIVIARCSCALVSLCLFPAKPLKMFPYEFFARTDTVFVLVWCMLYSVFV